MADAIADLVATPAGERPLRTVAGAIDLGVRELNAAVEPFAAKLLEGMGLGHLGILSPTDQGA